MQRETPEEYALDHIDDSIRELKRLREKLVRKVVRERRIQWIEDKLRWCFPINILFEIFRPWGACYSDYCNYLGIICNLIRYKEKGSPLYENIIDEIRSQSNVDAYRATRLMEILSLKGLFSEDIISIIDFVFHDDWD